MIDAQEVHRAVSWPAVLSQMGIADEYLRNRHGPCPACGGKDRYRFSNRLQRGDFYCNGCGPGDGFALLMRVHGWSFSEALKAVAETVGLESSGGHVTYPPSRPAAVQAPEVAHPTARVRDLLRRSSRLDLVPDAVSYLESRGLWPVGETELVAASLADYYEDRTLSGKYAALVAPIRDREGVLVSAHVTYLAGGRKASVSAPRKILSRLTGRAGCAIRLAPVAPSLGIAEGIETALAASRLFEIPVWSCIASGILAKWQPPEGVDEVTVFADRDDAGLEAAESLIDRLSETGVRARVRVPRWFGGKTDRKPPGDWNDVLLDYGRDG